MTHTRSQAPVRLSTRTIGSIVPVSLRSMLNRSVTGSVPSRSSISGIGSVPAILAADTCL